MSPCPVTVFVCTACGAGPGRPSPGEALARALLARVPGDGSVRIEPVDCLAVCDHPCTIAFSARDKWTYLVGGIDPDHDLDDILLAANRLAASEQPVLALADRPAFFRKGVIGRIPPV